MKKWKINSWKNYPVKHIPEYPDKKELDMVLGKIKRTFIYSCRRLSCGRNETWAFGIN